MKSDPRVAASAPPPASRPGVRFAPPSRQRLLGLTVCTMIGISIANGVSDGAVPAWPAGLLAWLVGISLFGGIPRFQQVQVALMCACGLAALALAASRQKIDVLVALVESNQAMLAMLATVSFLRMVTPSGAGATETLPRGRRALWQTLFATHLFGAVVNISAVFIVGHRIARDGALTPLQAKVVSRGFVAAACWSPLFAAMAVVLHYVPAVDMLAISRVNLVLALLLLGYCLVELLPDPAAPEFVGFPLHREALTVPVLLAALVVALYNLPTGWPILTVIELGAAGCVTALLLARPWRESRRLVAHHVDRELPRMGGEFALFLGAGLLAVGISALAGTGHIDYVLDPASATQAIPLLAVLVTLTLVGIHPVISVAALSGLFPARLTHPDLVGMVILMAWSVALGTSPFSGTTLAMQGRFGIPATRFLRWNLRYLLVGFVLASAVLVVVDYFAVA